MMRDHARFLVDYYYAVQDFRLQADSEIRAVEQGRDEGPQREVLATVAQRMREMEALIRRSLDHYTDEHVEGQWAKRVHGIGPVLAAGLLAHIDIERARTVGAIWRFAGLDPTVSWQRGQRRPWNHRLKVHCWRIADSFVTHRASPKDVYGRVYEQRKQYEVERNERGENRHIAEETLRTRTIRDPDTRAYYERGMLPPGRIDLRARRYAVKLFLAHYHHVAYEARYGEPPPRPYVIEHLGHVDYIAPPYWRDGRIID